jgi:MFS family permease
MWVYSIQYANGGLKFLLMLSLQDLFKNYYKLTPAESQFYITTIWMPWSLKFIYGAMADSISIFGSRKKAWLIFWGLFQTVALSITALVVIDSIQIFVAFIFMIQVAGCFMDVVVDSMMVVQARRDPKNGSQELQGFSWQITGAAAVVSGFASAYFTSFLTPYYCLGVYAAFGLAVFLSAFSVTQELEIEGDLEYTIALRTNEGG